LSALVIRQEPLIHLLSLRNVLVTGKGGVGKTTVAASLARWAAKHGKRTLIAEITTDSENASPLAHALGIASIPEAPLEIAENLRAVVLSPALGHQRFLRDVLPMRLLADAAMRSGAIRRFLSAAPTFPEMGVLYRLLELVRETRADGSSEHELIVVDLPATGHALALAQIPAAVLRVIPGGPIVAAVKEGLDLLRDARRTGAVIVTLPETLPVSEALELVRGLEAHEVPIAQLVLNRVPPNPLTDSEHAFLRTWLEGRPPTLGARTLERITRARDALSRSKAATRVPVATLEDLALEEPRLASELAERFAQEEISP
jgi:arsenite-transporting ATPase